MASGKTEAAQSGGTGAETNFSAIVDLLLTIGYIDGDFDHREQEFIRQYMHSVLLLIEESAEPDQAAAMVEEWRKYFEDLYRHFRTEVSALSDQAKRPDEDPEAYVPPTLRDRAVAVYKDLPVQDQETAMELLHGLIHADGPITPAEQTLYEDLAFHNAPPPAVVMPTAQMQALSGSEPPPAAPDHGPLIIGPQVWLDLVSGSDPILDPLEQTYSPHPVERQSQVEWDYQLIQRAMTQWQRQRSEGTGRLAGLNLVDQIPPGSRFLDGYVYAMRPDRPVELIVLGDVHGCYSCLKAALLQSNFVQRVWAHQWDPQNYPDVKLVLLGDYIDRGLFSFDGVLRAVLQLFVSMPDHVFVLRGNHEYLRWYDNRIAAVVHPAEALASIAPHVPIEMLEAYRVLFEAMPTSLICDQTMFVHAGIPRDDTFQNHFSGLSSLNDLEMRFQMMWSDPVQTQHVPLDMQKQNPRFTFGYNQFKAFMERTGLRAMVRGHEKIDSGFEVVYNLGDHMLLNLFSAGGHDNCDLPANSSYRRVTPMALTMHYGHGTTPTATPWPLQYQPFNYPPHNGLYRPHPLLTFRYL